MTLQGVLSDDDTMTSKGSEIVKSKTSSSKTRAKVHPKKSREDFLAKARLEAEEEAEEAAAKKKKSKDSKAKNSRRSAAEKKKATKKKSKEYDSDDYEGDDTTVVYLSDEEEASDPEDDYQPTQKEGRVAKEVAERSVRPTRTSTRTANKGKKSAEENAKVDQASTAKTTGRRRKKGQAKKGRGDMGLDIEDEEFSLGSNERDVAPKGRGSSKAKPSSKSTNNGMKKRKSSSGAEEACIDPTKSGRKMKKSKSLKKKEESALELDDDEMSDVAAATEKNKSRRSSKSKQAKPTKAADKKKEKKEDDDDVMSDGEEESKSMNTSDLQVEYTNEEEEDDDDTATFYPLTQAPTMTQYMQSESQESEVTVQTKGSKKIKSVTLDTRRIQQMETAEEACEAVNKLGTQAQTQMSSTISPDGTKASTKNSLAGGGESTTSKSNVSFANDGGQEYDDQEFQSKDSKVSVAEAMHMLGKAKKLLDGATKLLERVEAQDRA